MGETEIPFNDLHSREYQGHKKKVHSVAWNCSGTKLASSSVDQTACVWQIEPHGHIFCCRKCRFFGQPFGKSLKCSARTFPKLECPVRTISFNRTGEYISSFCK